MLKSFANTDLISQLVWKWVPDGGSSDRECPTAEYAVLVTQYIRLNTYINITSPSDN